MVALYTRVHHDTLVNISDEYMGFQSALHNPRDAHDQLRTLVNACFMHMGLSINPWILLENDYLQH